MPDLVFPIVLVFASALRLYWRVILVSIALNAAAIVALVRMDIARNGRRINFSWNDVQMVAVELAAAGAAACIAAWAARRALGRIAIESQRSARGRRHLDNVLREHHHVRTLLTSAALQIDYLRQEVTPREHVERLAVIGRAVDGIRGSLDEIKTRTFGELLLTDDIKSVDAMAIVEGAVSVTRDRFPDAAIRSEIGCDLPRVLLFGGDRALAHVMVNLLVNACEGDGSRCAKSVIVSVTSDTPARGLVTFELTDDGPGFSIALLEASTRGGLTTKTTGTGLGLSLVAHIVEASGGTVHLRNLPESGASVSISLRAAPVR